jgi:hypothetical protein
MDIPDLPAMAFQHIGDKKIKPQGGGGSFNPIAAITDPISSALGTDGGGGGILGAVADIDPGPSIGSALASVDPGPAIGSGLAEVDTFVNREIPGGWTLPAVIAVAYLTGYLDPSLLAAEGATVAGTAEGAALAGEAAFSSAVASGATAAEATALANAAATSYATAGAAGGAAGSGLSAAELLAVGGFTPAAGSGASFAIPSAIATGAGAGGSIGGIELGGAFLPTAGSGASFAVPGTVGAGSSLLGPTYGELGLTGVEGGLAGPTYGELGLTGLELGTEASTGAPIFDYSQEVILSPGGNYIPANTLPSEIAGLDESIRIAGEAAIKAAPSTISPSQAVNTLRGASGLLGGQQGTPAAATAQFRGSTVPQGAVDYSGILNLLQTRAQQRNPYSLLG